MHGRNVRYVSLLKPKIIVKGGFSCGKCMIDGVPAAFTGPGGYAIIAIEGENHIRIEHYIIHRRGGKVKREKISAGTPPFYRNMGWVAPIPHAKWKLE